ncbi:MAG TPA: dihydroxy-acid dehydratase [Ruminiclostridium sp.]
MDNNKLRSKKILGRPEGSSNRCVFKALGYSDKDLEKPIIGIANSWNELVPGHFNLRQLADYVKRGIYAAGGIAVEFGFIAACDGTAQGNDGMRFILPSRDLIANDLEVMMECHQLDGIVMLGSCDKIVPGMLMAAARSKIPAIILPGGPMLGGPVFDGRKSDFTSLSEAIGKLKNGKMSEDEFVDLEEACAPTCGSCAYLGTANTMCFIAEALGMTLENAALIPAVYAQRLRIAQKTGEAIVNLVNKNILPKNIITKESICNAIKVLNTIGGSTNAVIHLIAIASELDITAEEMMKYFDEISKTMPQIVKVNPASKYDMEDFYLAGGIPRVMKEIQSMLNIECMTVTGNVVSKNFEEYKLTKAVNRDVIRSIDNPFDIGNGLAVLRGNLSPDSCVTKPAAIAPEMRTFTGKAVVFNCEEAAEEAILSGGIKAGDVVVIRYEGPKGGPGMREMYKAMKFLYGMGLSLSTALVTDGRFSGTNNGCFVGHISPEAAEGGPIAAVCDGDIITIDIPNRSIHLHVSDDELRQRLSNWKRPDFKYKKGYLAIYERYASSAAQGAVIKMG